MKLLRIRKQWEKFTELRTINNALLPITSDSIKAYKHELSKEEQWALCNEVVQTRASELCLAYESVINIFAGHKVKSSTNKRGYTIERTPSISFVVKKKRKIKNPIVKIPAYILIFYKKNGLNKAYAIPTDIIDASEHHITKLNSNILISSNSGYRGTGTITCVIRRELNNVTRYFYISCQHVFSLIETLYPTSNVGSNFSYSPTNSTIGTVGAVKGKIFPGSAHQYSLDSQIGIPQDAQALQAIIVRLRLNGNFVQGDSDIPNTYYIQTSNGPVACSKSGLVQESVRYKRVGYLTHQYLLKSYMASVGVDGDSGAPITTERDGGTLIGMQIGSTIHQRRYIGFAIPAWLFLNPQNYVQTNPNEIWRLA